MLKRIVTVLVLTVCLIAAFATVAQASMGESGGIRPASPGFVTRLWFW